MREATVELQEALEYCKEIVNAESEEEIIAIKQEIAANMREDGAPEESITHYLQQLDDVTERIEEGEYIITENGLIANKEQEETYEVVETSIPEPTNTESQANTKAGLAIGLAGAAIVTTLALKNKLLKAKKNSNSESFHK